MIELIILPILALAIWLIMRNTGMPDPASLSDEGLTTRISLEQAWLDQHAAGFNQSGLNKASQLAKVYGQRRAYLIKLTAELASRAQTERR